MKVVPKLNSYQIQQKEFSEMKVLDYLEGHPLPYYNVMRREISLGTVSLRRAIIRLLLKGKIIKVELGRKYRSYIFFIRSEDKWIYDYLNQVHVRDSKTKSRMGTLKIDQLKVMLFNMVRKSKRSVCKEYGISVSQFDRLVDGYPVLKRVKRGIGL